MTSNRVVKNRCAILMGRAGAGKSTVANHLIGYDSQSSDEPPFKISDGVLASLTRDVKYRLVEVVREGVVYRVTVIDTDGEFDSLMFDEIGKRLKVKIEDRITGVNVMLFVLKKGPISAEELTTYAKLRNTFDISSICALVITGCENDSSQGRAELVKKFMSHPITQQVADQMKMGIYTVGFPPVQSMIPALQEVYKQGMLQDRETLLNLIFQADKVYLTKNLFIEKKKQSSPPPVTSGRKPKCQDDRQSTELLSA